MPTMKKPFLSSFLARRSSRTFCAMNESRSTSYARQSSRQARHDDEHGEFRSPRLHPALLHRRHRLHRRRRRRRNRRGHETRRERRRRRAARARPRARRRLHEGRPRRGQAGRYVQRLHRRRPHGRSRRISGISRFKRRLLQDSVHDPPYGSGG